MKKQTKRQKLVAAIKKLKAKNDAMEKNR